MRTQLHNWRILVDHIIDKVWEYIDEIDYWDDEPKLWVEAESDTVVLGSSARTRPARWSRTSTALRTSLRAGSTSVRRSCVVPLSYLFVQEFKARPLPHPYTASYAQV